MDAADVLTLPVALISVFKKGYNGCSDDGDKQHINIRYVLYCQCAEIMSDVDLSLCLSLSLYLSLSLSTNCYHC